MTGRTIDVIASGPCPSDPYDPAAPAWALATGAAAWGDRVRVLHPAGPAESPPPEGVESRRIELPLRRPGSAVEEASLASIAGRRLSPGVDLVVRDPIGLGSVLGGRRRRDAPTVVGVARDVELALYDHESLHQHPAGWRGRVDTWRDRRAVRRLEQEAVAEAERVYCEDSTVQDLLAREYGLSAARLSLAPPPVRLGDLPTREAARRALKLPLDVPVVAAPLASDDPDSLESHHVQEAFHRARSLFAGARLVAVGAEVTRTEPGAVWVAARDAPSFEQALAAADIAIVAPATLRFDPGAVLALRVGCPVLASPNVRFPVDPQRAVRVSTTADPADLAAALAELLADSEQRHRLVEAGGHYAERFEPERVAATVTAEMRLLAA